MLTLDGLCELRHLTLKAGEDYMRTLTSGFLKVKHSIQENTATESQSGAPSPHLRYHSFKELRNSPNDKGPSRLMTHSGSAHKH